MAKIWEKIFIALMLFSLSNSTFAARFLPENMDMAIMKQANFPAITLSPEGFTWLKLLTFGWLDRAKTFQMSSTVRIRDQNNRFIVWGRLPEYAGKAVAVRRDYLNNINEIWILTPQEQEVYHQRALLKKAQSQ